MKNYFKVSLSLILNSLLLVNSLDVEIVSYVRVSRGTSYGQNIFRNGDDLELACDFPLLNSTTDGDLVSVNFKNSTTTFFTVSANKTGKHYKITN